MLNNASDQNTIELEKGEQACYHCGDPCVDEVYYEDHVFCCNGCSKVYQILKENNLDSFYTINPGERNNAANKFEEEYAYLKNEEIVQKLISFQTNDVQQIEINLPQIHCSACIWLLERLNKINPGIIFSRVDFLKKKVTINYKVDAISLYEVAHLLHSIGYPPKFYLADDTQGKTPKQTLNKMLLYRIAVAGFCFGNIMLISFPEYLSSNYDDLYVFFAYLKLLLAIPVLLFAGWEYLKAGVLWIKNRTVGIDLPIAIGMTALFSRSAYEVLSGTGEGYFDSFSGFIFLLLLGRWFQERTYGSISFDRDFKSFFPIAIAKKIAAKWESVSLDRIEKGDLIRVKHNEIIPCDGELMEGNAKIDYSFVTGESKLNSVSLNADVFAGGKVVGGIMDIKVTRPISHSRLTKLWNNDIFQKNDELIEKNIIDLIGRYFVVIIVSIAVLAFIYWIPIDVSKAFKVLTSVLIVACPCVLALSVPFIYGNGIRHLSKFGIHLKNVYTLFRFQDIDHIVFDKTGTLTDADHIVLNYEGSELTPNQQSLARSLAYHSNHPFSVKIKEYFQKAKLLEVEDFQEIPGLGISGTIDDHKIKIGSSKFVLGKPSEQALSVSYLSIDDQLVGEFIFQQPIEEDIKSVLQDLHYQKYNLSLLSGDSQQNEEIDKLFENKSNIFYQQSPEDKLNKIISFQQSNEKVMMVGDGLNDAGAFKQSQIGLVLVKNNNQFTPAADIIMERKNLKNLPILLKHSIGYKRLLYISFVIAILYNMIGLIFAVSGKLSPLVAAILMPISSLTIVAFGFISSSLLTRKLKKQLIV